MQELSVVRDCMAWPVLAPCAIYIIPDIIKLTPTAEVIQPLLRYFLQADISLTATVKFPKEPSSVRLSSVQGRSRSGVHDEGYEVLTTVAMKNSIF
jgi:hypothetical protein